MKTKTQFTNRILSLVLSIMMVISMLPASALSVFAAEGDVASVTTTEGTQTYADLTSAFAAAEQAENSVLTLLADTTISSTVYVYGGKFTVDLNGKTWTANSRALGILGADMRITDSTADGLGKIVGTTGNDTIMIGNGTKLEVAGGTVENTRDGRCIDTQYNGHTSDAQFTLSGGKLITAGWSAIHVDCTSVTIKNGEIKSQGDAYYHGDDHDYRSGLLDFSQHPDPTGIAVINYAGVEIIPGDTTIKLPSGYCFYEQDANQPVTALPADMTNGYIIGKAPVCTCEERCSTDSINSACAICGVDIAFCTGGVQAQAKIGDTYYTTLVEAAAKVTEGDTIDVLTDVTIGADESVTFATFAALNVAEGKTVTCSGTVKIGEEDGIIFENTLYYYGGDRTNEEWQDFQTILQLTCWTAGEGHVTYGPETNTLSLYNATSTFFPDSASNGCLEYAQESASEPMTINFRGVNTLTSENRQVFWIETPVTMNGIGPNAVLNVIGLDTNHHEPCCRFESDLTVNSGTVNVRANIALECTELTVASGAELNAAGGYDASGIYVVLRTGKITGDGTVNALVLDGSAINETTQLPYVVYGNAALENDLLLHDPHAGTEDAGNFRFAFIVPQNSKLTMNEGVTLDLSTVALENIDFTGTVINNGTILLPADFALDSAPKSGNIKIGEKSYTYDIENNKWICAGGSHTMDVTTGKCVCGLEMAEASATIGGVTTYYSTLDAAIQAVSSATEADNATVKLLADVDLGSTSQTISSGVFTLDLNGKTIIGSASDVLNIIGDTVTIDDSAEDGTINSTNSAGTCVSVYDSTVTVTGGTFTGGQVGIYSMANSTVAITDGTFSTNKIGVAVYSSTVTITGGTFIGETAGRYCAVDSLYGTLTISGGTFSGIGNTLLISESTVTITGGTISGTAYDIRQNGNGMITLTLAEGKTEGATFPGGITVYGTTLGAILDSDMGYWQGEKMIVPSEDQTEITGGDVTVKAACKHENGTPSYAPNADNEYAHDVTWSCCGGVVTESCHDMTDTVSPDGATCTFACGFCKRPIETWTIVTPVCTVYGDGNSCEATVLLDGKPVEGSIVFTYYQQVNDGWRKLEAAPTNAGTYRAEVVLIDGADYGENDVIIYVEYTIAKATPVVTPPTPKVGMPYTNLYFSLFETGAQTTGGKLMYKVNDGEWSNSTVLRQNWSAGTYNVYWKVVGDENYESVDTGEFITVIWLQQELDKINPTVTLSSESFVYDGTAKTPAVSIVTNLPYTDHTGSNNTGTTVTLEKDKDFTVTYSDNVNAGTATVTIQGIGNFKGTVTKTFTITDKTIPTGTILIKENGWNKFWNTITFGIFCKDYVHVTVTADGTGSGVAKVEYLLSGTVLEENNIPVDGWTTLNADNGSYRFSIQPQSKVAVYVRITDEAGNETVINSDGIVVYEDSKVVDTEVTYTYKENSNKDVAVAFNGNTVKSIVCGEKTLAVNRDYTVDYESGKIVLTASYLDTLNAGNYTFTVSYNPMGVENSGVTDLTTTFILVIDKVDGKVSNINISGKTYDGTAVTTPTYDKLGNGVVTIEYKAKGADDSTYTTTAPKNVGNYVVRVTAAEGTNHKAASATAEFSIDRATLTATVEQVGTLTYNGTAQTPTIKTNSNALVTAGVGFLYSTAIDGNYITQLPAFTDAGTYTVYFKAITQDGNYYDDSGSFEVRIGRPALNATVEQTGTLTYNGTAQTPMIKTDSDALATAGVGFLYSTAIDGNYITQLPAFTDAGTYTVYFKATAQDGNYYDDSGSFEVTIAKKAVTVTANDASKTYGDSDPALTYTHTELIGSDALDITVSRASGENANTYTITASQTEGANPNYEITFKTGTFTIRKAALTVTAEDKTATYGDAVPNYTVKYEGFKNGDDKDDLGGALAFECDYAQFSDKGEYIIKASGYTSGNYTISYVDGKLTVNAKPITVTIQNATSVYSDTLAELKATDNGIVNGDANVYSLATTATGTSNAGKYAITGTALDSNYDVTFVNGEYEITKREITITVDAKNTVVNTTLPTYTYKVEGLVGVDALVTEPTFTCNANIAVIGEYDITASGADAGDNYSIKYVPAKLTVLTDNAVDAAKGYTEELKDYDPATVTSEDKAELEEMLFEINTILADETTTDNGKKALEKVKEQVEKLIKEINDAAEATDTENTEKVENVTPENVTPENKTDLEGAKADLEKALEDNGGNYTEDEKKAIEDAIKRIDDALEVIGNVEEVEETISKLPAVDTVKPDDEEAIKAITDAQTAYNVLSDYEKSLVDEATKANLDKLVAALVAYDIVEGDGSSWTEDSDHNITFVANGLFTKFVGIKVDGKDVDKANYEAKAGSTIITLKASYLDTLAVGEHTITVIYNDGSTDGTFNVHAKANSPATGDNSNMFLWIALLFISGGAVITLTVVERKKRMASNR